MYDDMGWAGSYDGMQGSKYRVHTCTSAGTFFKVQVHFTLYLHLVQVACLTINDRAKL